MTSELQKLKGRVLRSVSTGKTGDIPKDSRAYGGVFGQNRDTITFHCDDGDYVFLADGDCCSETFIHSVEGPQRGRILDVLEPNWSGDDGRSREEKDGELKYYKATFVIENEGHLDVEYRNESNGYYGGSLELLSAPAADSSCDPGGDRG